MLARPTMRRLFSARPIEPNVRPSSRSSFWTFSKRLGRIGVYSTGLVSFLAYGYFAPRYDPIGNRQRWISCNDRIPFDILTGRSLYCMIEKIIDKMTLGDEQLPIAQEEQQNDNKNSTQHVPVLPRDHFLYQKFQPAYEEMCALANIDCKMLKLRFMGTKENRFPGLAYLFANAVIILDAQFCVEAPVDVVMHVIAHELGHYHHHHINEYVISILPIKVLQLLQVVMPSCIVGLEAFQRMQKKALMDWVDSRCLTESEADAYGMMLATKSGYSPHFSWEFFEQLEAEEPQPRTDILHPPPAERSQALRALVKSHNLMDEVLKTPRGQNCHRLEVLSNAFWSQLQFTSKQDNRYKKEIKADLKWIFASAA